MENQNPQPDSFAEEVQQETPAEVPAAAIQQEPEEPRSQDQGSGRTIGIVAVGLALIAICLCLAIVSFAGSGIFGGGSEPDATATPAPTPTDVPTPEPGEPPTAVISAPSNGVVDQEIIFDGSHSQAAPGSNITSYIWEFGDGTGARGISVAYAYSEAGSYTVKLTVTDQDGLSDSANLRVNISDPTPTPTVGPTETPEPTATGIAPAEAVISAPTEAKVGDVVTFDGSASTSGYPIVNYVWDFGDRTQGIGQVVDHVYSQGGTYEVTLTITDNGGQTGVTRTRIDITQDAQTPPTASIEGPAEASVGEDVTFDGGGSQPGSSEIVDYAWDFGNGSSKNGQQEVTVTTRYNTPDRYVVSLTVTDANGLSDTATREILINAKLEGTPWYLGGVLPDSTITLELKNGNVNGSSGCNQYSGSYTIDDPNNSNGSIRFSELVTTQQLCPDDVMGQESRYLTALAAVNTYRVSGNTLSLTLPGGVLTYTDVPLEAQPR